MIRWMCGVKLADTFTCSELRESELEFNVPCQHKYGYIRDKRSGMESYPYPVKEG